MDARIDLQSSPAAGPPSDAALTALRSAVDLLASGQPREAIPGLEALVQGYPDWAIARAYLGSAYIEVARVEEARVALELAVAAAPGSFVCGHRHAQYLTRMGFFDQAVTELDRVLRLPAPDMESRQDALMLREACARRSRGIYYRTTAMPRLPGFVTRGWRRFAASRRAETEPTN